MSTANEKLELARRLSAIVDKLGTRENAAKVAGVSRSQLHLYLRGENLPSVDAIKRLAKAAGVSVGWLLTGEEESQCRHRDYVFIPVFDVGASAGHGRFVHDESVTETIALKRTWITRELFANPEEVCLIHVEGESMEPTLRPGDMVLLDLRDTAVRRDAIYVLRIGDALLVKRLQRMPNNMIRASSDNPAYQPFDLSPADLEKVQVIGRVIWAGRRL